MSTNSVKKNHYISKQTGWERGSSIRTRPRRILSEEENTNYFFPLSRQPLCIHPIILNLGETARQFILTQSLYKFMMDIAILETEVVNSGALMIANSKLLIPFSEEIKQDALSVIIDEAYHAYVAIDFMKQVENKTKIYPVCLPESSAALIAIATIKKELAPSLQDIFELIAVCIGEHVLTYDLISIGKEANVNKTFSEVMADHVLDEGRHANIFKHVLKQVWAHLSVSEQDTVGSILPRYMRTYLDVNSNLQKDYDTKILLALNLNDAEIQQIIAETYVEYEKEPIAKTNPVIFNLITLLEGCHVLDNVNTKQAFLKENFL